jgi:CSLREA domain-containing protein
MKNQKKLYVTYFVMIFALILMSVSAAQAATFTVDAAVDAHDTNPGDGFCHSGWATCSLRAAIEEANELPGYDIINFSNSFEAPNAPKTIVLKHAELLVYSDMTINGPGARQLTIDGNDKSRVFLVSGSSEDKRSVLINNLTIQNGNSAFGGGAQGGGVYVAWSSAVLSKVTIRNNKAIMVNQSGRADGGGIFNFASVLYVIDSTISNNVAEDRGGGIMGRDGVLYIYNSTISDNFAKTKGGGVYQKDNGSIRNTTITNNNAIEEGGGLFIDNAKPDGFHYLGNTIVADNFAPINKDVSGEMISMGSNLVENRGNSKGYVVTDLPDGTAPLVGSLKNNGGQTNTRALLPDSPAINAGNNCIVLGNPCSGDFEFDQRGLGFTRKFGRTVDIGAFEYQGEFAIVQIRGKVLKPNGRGLNKAVVTLIGGDGEQRSGETDQHGNFSFDNVRTGERYIIKVESRHYNYAPQDLFVSEEGGDVRFVPVGEAEPPDTE